MVVLLIGLRAGGGPFNGVQPDGPGELCGRLGLVSRDVVGSGRRGLLLRRTAGISAGKGVRRVGGLAGWLLRRGAGFSRRLSWRGVYSCWRRYLCRPVSRACKIGRGL